MGCHFVLLHLHILNADDSNAERIVPASLVQLSGVAWPSRLECRIMRPHKCKFILE
jgi:hypothetical protein